MSDKESLLALAKAVYPDYEWKMDGNYPYRMVRTDRYVIFNPAGDDRQYQGASEHAIEVQCWLNKTAGTDVDFGPDCIGIWNDVDCRYERIDHDNTPASFRKAIVQAACRMVAA